MNMNKKMRDLLGAIEQKTAEARQKQEENNTAAVDALLSEIDDLRKSYEREEKLFQAEQRNEGAERKDGEPENRHEAEVKAFAGYIRAAVGKEATPQNINIGNNGAIIPITIAQEIIGKVREMCPILDGATKYNVKGKLQIPVYTDATDDEDNVHSINVAWAEDFTELTADAGKFTSIDLTGHLAGALTLIGRSMINNTDIDLVDFVVKEMAKSIAAFIEGKLLNGDDGKNQGALSTANTMEAASATAVTADELIDLQTMVPQVHQANACWTIHPSTLPAIRKLKYAGTGEYILQPDFTGKFPYRLLGKPVQPSDNMPKLEAGKAAVLYGDYAGLAVKMTEEVEMQVLAEKYATMHAVGVVAWVEFDSAVADKQKLATLTMKAG
jgi:HK97 family phage major capsid protein